MYQQAGLEPGRIKLGMYSAAVGDLLSMEIPSTADGTILTVGADTFNLGGPARITCENATHPGQTITAVGVLSYEKWAGGSADPIQLKAQVLEDPIFRELWDRIDGQTFGAWAYDEAGLGHLVFYPNRLIPGGEAERRARLINCVLDEARRLAWLDKVWGEVAAASTGA